MYFRIIECISFSLGMLTHFTNVHLPVLSKAVWGRVRQAYQMLYSVWPRNLSRQGSCWFKTRTLMIKMVLAVCCPWWLKNTVTIPTSLKRGRELGKWLSLSVPQLPHLKMNKSKYVFYRVIGRISVYFESAWKSTWDIAIAQQMLLQILVLILEL